MFWPEFESLFPGAKASTHLPIDPHSFARTGPTTWTVEWRGKSVTRPDRSGVLSEIAEVLNG